MPATATIRDVELVSVGTWAASTGVTTVTRADLDAMLAAQADGLVDHAPIKLGHVSPLNDTLGDGAPAYGWVIPTGIRPNAAGADTLIGDLVGMPAKLAEVAPAAYRRRSVEIAWNVKTAQGKTYAAALVGVALLGAQAPAVKGLADLVALYSGEPQVDRVETIELVDGLEGNPVAVAMLAAARTAGAPVEQLDTMAAAAGARDTADVPQPTPDPDHDDTTSTAGQAGATDTGGHTMTVTEEQLRAALGLAADADVDAEVNRLISERATDPATASTDPAPVEPAATTTDPVPVATSPATDPAPVAQEPELVQLSAGTYAELTQLAEERRQARREEALDGAIRAGRIAPAERAHFAAALERDEEGTITLLGQLAPRFAVTEFGDDRAQETQLSEGAEAAFDEFERTTFGIRRD